MRILLSLVILMMTVSAARAEPPGGHDDIVTPQQRQEMRDLMGEGATRQEAAQQVLSEEQRSQLKALRGAEGGKQGHGKGKRKGGHMQALDLSAEQREEIRELRAAGASREDIQAVLTEEQRTQLKELRRDKKGKGKQHRGGKDGEPGPAVAEQEDEEGEGEESGEGDDE